MKTPRVRSAIWAMCTAIVLTYLVPVLAGFPAWPGASTHSTLIHHAWAADTVTFDLGYRPMRIFLAQQLEGGHLPLWLPWQMLGLPLVEQSEYQIFNPLEWLNWLGGDLWWSVVLCGYLLAGAEGVRRLCRYLGVPEIACMAGALAYGIAGYAPWFYTVTSFMTAIPVIPWLLYFTVRLFQEPVSVGIFAGLWAALTLLLLCGQTQISFCTLVFLLVLAIVLSIATGRAGGRVRSAWLAGVVAMVLAVAVAMPQLWGFVAFQLSGEAFSTHALSRFATGLTWRTSPTNLLNPVFPYALGVAPYDIWNTNRYMAMVPTEDFPLSFYATGGLLVLAGGVAALTGNDSRRRSLAICAVVLYGLISLMSLTTWPVWPFYFVNLARYASPLLACLCAILLGFGLQAVGEKRRMPILAATAALGGALLVLVAVIVHFTAATDIASRGILAHSLFLNAVSLFGALAICWLALSGFPGERGEAAALAIFAADALFQFRYGFALYTDFWRIVPYGVAVVGAMVFAWRGRGLMLGVTAAGMIIVAGWMGFSTQVEKQGPSPEYLWRLSGLLHGHRVASSIDALIPNRGAALGIDVVGSRNPVQFAAIHAVLKDQFPRFRDFVDFRGISKGARTGDSLSWEEYCGARDLFNRLSVDSLVDYPGGALAEALLRNPACAVGMVPVPNDLNLDIYRDTHALPRAYIASACEVRTADLACARPFSGSEAVPPAVQDVGAGTVEVRVAGGDGGMLILNDAYHKDWVAYVDGKRQTVQRVNGFFRGVPLPSGGHAVRFSYEPNMSVRWVIAILGVALGALGLWRLARSGRRSFQSSGTQ